MRLDQGLCLRHRHFQRTDEHVQKFRLDPQVRGAHAQQRGIVSGHALRHRVVGGAQQAVRRRLGVARGASLVGRLRCLPCATTGMQLPSDTAVPTGKAGAMSTVAAPEQSRPPRRTEQSTDVPGIARRDKDTRISSPRAAHLCRDRLREGSKTRTSAGPVAAHRLPAPCRWERLPLRQPPAPPGRPRRAARRAGRPGPPAAGGRPASCPAARACTRARPPGPTAPPARPRAAARQASASHRRPLTAGQPRADAEASADEWATWVTEQHPCTTAPAAQQCCHAQGRCGARATAAVA